MEDSVNTTSQNKNDKNVNEPLNDAYNEFSKGGYNGNIQEFENLLKTNKSALNDAHKMFEKEGYTGDIEDFNTLLGLKKKDSTGPSQEQDLVSAPRQEDTSLATERNDALTQNITGESFKQKPNTPETEQVDSELPELNNDTVKNRVGEELEVDESIASLYDQYRDTLSLSTDKEDKKEKRISFLEDIDPIQKEKLNSYIVDNYVNLEYENQQQFKEIKILKEKSKSLLKKDASNKKTLELLLKEGKEVPQEFLDEIKASRKEYTNIYSEIENGIKNFENNQGDLDSFSKELEYLKKNYGTIETLITRATIGMNSAVSGMLDFMVMSGEALPSWIDPFRTEEEVKAEIDNMKSLSKDLRKSGKNLEQIVKPALSVSDIKNPSDFGMWAMEQIATQGSNFAIMGLSGGTAGIATIGASAAGNKKAELLESNAQGKTDISNLKMNMASYGFGLLEAGTELITYNIGSRVFKSVLGSEAEELVKQGAKGFLKDLAKKTAYNALEESFAEGLNAFGGNIIDIDGLGLKNKNYSDGVIDSMASGGFVGGAMTVTPMAAGKLIGEFTTMARKKAVSKNIKKLEQIKEEIDNNPDLSEVVKKELLETVNRIHKENASVLGETIEFIESKTADELKDISEVERSLKGVIETIKAIENDTSISSDTKEFLLNNKKQQFQELSEKKESLINKTSETEASPLDSLTEEQKLKAKEQDSKDIENEQEQETTQQEYVNDRTEINLGDKFNYSFGLARDGVVEVIRDLGNGIVETRYSDGTIKKERKINLLTYLNNPNNNTYTELSNSNTETTTSNTSRDNSQNNNHKLNIREISDRLDNLEQYFLNNGKTEYEAMKLALDSITAEERQFLSNVKTKNSQQDSNTDTNEQEQETTQQETQPPLETSTPSTEVEQEKVESDEAELKNKKQELESILAEDAKTKEDTGQGSLNDRNAVVKELQDVNNKLNETQAEGNDTPNGEVRPTDSTSVSKQETEAVQPSPESNTSEKPTERKLTNTKTITTGKGKSYTVERNEKGITVKDEKGKEPSAPTKRKILKEYADSIDLTEGDKYEGNEQEQIDDFDTLIAENSNNPAELAEVALRTSKSRWIEDNTNEIARQIIDYVSGTVKRSSFVNENDVNNIANSMARTYFDKNGRTLDVIAEELSDDLGLDISIQDIVDLILQYPNGINDLNKEFRDKTSNPAKQRFTELTGLPASDIYLQKAVDQQIAKEKLNNVLYLDYLNYLSDAELTAMAQEQKDYEEYIKKEELSTNQGNESTSQTRNTSESKERSEVQSGIGAETKGSQGRPREKSKTKTDTRNTRGKDKPIDKTIDKSILPDVSKKGDTKTVKLSDNVEAKITTVEFFDGSPGYSVSIFKDGAIVEEKTGDTETEFSDNESSGVIKFVKNKQKGQKLLKAKQAKSKNNDSKTETKNKPSTDSKTEYKEKRVSFTVFGETFTGQQKSDGSIKSDQGTVYTKGMVSNVKDTTQKQVDNTTENSNRLSPITKKQFTRLVHRLNKAFPKVKVTANAKKFNETLQKLVDNTDSQLKFLKNSTGVVYGFVNSKTGQIFINPDALNANTPIHEFAHIWVNALKGANRALFKKGLSLIDGTKYHKQVAENDAYINLTDDQILEEALVTAIGDKGEAFVKDLTKSKFREFLDSVKKFLGDKFFINKKNKISKLTLDQFLDGSLSDLLGGKDLKNSPVSSDNFTNKEALEYVRSINKKTDTQLENNDSTKQKIRKIVRKIIKAYSDRQFLPKKLLEEIGATYSKNLLINTKGASGRAKWFYEDAYDKIYKKLPDELRAKLDELIQLKRIVAIETTRKEKGIDPKKKPIKHPGGQTLNSAQKAINGLKEELGDKVFNDLDNRANEHFKVFHKLLDLMRDNGLISQDSYDKMKNTDYQPRLFVQHILDYEGSVRLGNSSNDLSRSSSLAKEQVKNLEEGSENGLIRDSEYLLSTMINARMKAMATNTANREFITNEFPKAKKRYESLRKKRFDKKNWSREDKRFYDYFAELNKMVKDNPIVKKVKNKDQLVIDGMVPEYIVEHKYKKEPKGFKRAYYYENGIRKEFFLENDFHDQWFDNLQGFLNPNAKELISYASGSAILKGVATGANPAFVLTNTPRDFAFTILFSKEYSTNVLKGAVQLFKDTRIALKEIKKKEKGALGDNLLDKYIQYGGDMSFLSTQGKIKEGSMLSKQLNKIVGKRGKERAKYIFDKVTLSKINNYSELMFRVALFQRSINNELKAKGYKNVSEVTDSKVLDEIYTNSVSKARSLLDFNQGGSITKDLESVIPYINSAVQGTRVATDALSKDPAIVGFKLLQASVYASAVPIGMSIALLSAFKDDDDERTATEIYLDALDGVSAYQKQMYLNIVLPIKDDDGEHYVVKIAKAHVMTPVTSITDAIMEHKLNEFSGRKKKDSKLIFDQALTAFNNNVLPIDFKDPISNFTRTPLIKSVMTYKTGHDFYRDQPLTFNSDKNHPEILDGARDKNVENFYKSIGKKYEMSPARLKGAVESLITSRSTNPYVNLIYGGAEAITSGDKSLKEIGAQLGKDILSTPVKRLSSTTSDFNRRVNKNRKFKDLEKEIYLKNTYKKYEAQELMVKYYKDEISSEEAIEKMESFDEVQKKQAKTKIRSLAKFEGISATAKTIFFTQDKELRAFRLLTSYGDLFDGSEENEEAIKELRKIKAIDKETFSHYNRMVKEFGK